MAPAQPRGSRAPPAFPSPGLAARGSRRHGAEWHSDRPARRGLEFARQEPTPAGSLPAPGARRPRPTATPAAAGGPAQRHGGAAGRVTQRPPRRAASRGQEPRGGQRGARRARSRGRGVRASPRRCRAAPPPRRSMRPGPAGDPQRPAGWARPCLFLGRKHVRGERAEVTVPERRRKGAAEPAGPPFALARARNSPAVRAPPAPWKPERPSAQAGPRPLGRSEASLRLSGRGVSARRCRGGKFGRCHPVCRLRPRPRAAWGHFQHPGVHVSSRSAPVGPLSDGAQK